MILGDKIITFVTFEVGDVLQAIRCPTTTVVVEHYNGRQCMARYLTAPLPHWIGKIYEIKEEWWELKP